MAKNITGSGAGATGDATFVESIKSLIDTNGFAQALQKLQKKADPRLKYLEAYCYYRSSKFEDALRIIDSMPKSAQTAAVEELRAQTFYRLGRFQEALTTYMQLFDDQSAAAADEFQTERMCNTLCVLTKLHEEDIPNVPDFNVPQSVKRYEVEFNSASLDISKGHFSKAHQRLVNAIELYKAEAKAQQIPKEEAGDEIAMLERQRDFAQSIASIKTSSEPAGGVGKSSAKPATATKGKKTDAAKQQEPTTATSQQAQSTSSSSMTATELDALENNFWGQFVALKRKVAAKVAAQPVSKSVKIAAGSAAGGDAKKAKKKKPTATATASPGGGSKSVSKSPSTKATAAGSTANDAGIKKRKHKKPRLPKNYDPSVQPDPERWLPMHERSYYRGKKRTKDNKQSAVGKGTQGAVQADLSSPVQGIQNSPASMPQQAAGPRQQQGPTGGKKKSGAGGGGGGRRGGGKR